ncbi:MAG: glycosyltransferase family 4 protein [Aquificaceae bacterium]|nr:glycosyltransferase family 4 protein [Aquificaceae bacterium]
MFRIALTSNTSFSLYNFRIGLMRRLKEYGFEVHTVAPEDEYSPLLKEEFFFHPLIHLNRKGTNPLKDALLFLEYLRLYKEIKPDLVINYTIKPNIYSSLSCGILKIPVISVITGLGYVFIKGGLLKFLVKLLYRIALPKNRYLVFQNQRDYNQLYQLLPPSSIIIHGSGVNTDYFSPKYCSEEKVINKTIFLFIGRFLRDKGIIELVEVGKKLQKEGKDFEIWFLGSTDSGNPASIHEKELENLKQLPFLTIIPFTKYVREHICKADCVVLPSYYGEGVPRALLEAMAMEKPIITSDIPGCRELISNDNGFLVRPRDVGDLYDKMNKFLELSYEERVEMGRKGRELILKRYDERIIVEKYVEIIMEVLNAHKSKSSA